MELGLEMYPALHNSPTLHPPPELEVEVNQHHQECQLPRTTLPVLAWEWWVAEVWLAVGVVQQGEHHPWVEAAVIWAGAVGEELEQVTFLQLHSLHLLLTLLWKVRLWK